jgi:hypothetical protein
MNKIVPLIHLKVDLLVRLEVSEINLFEAESRVQGRLVDLETSQQILPAALVVDLETKIFTN